MQNKCSQCQARQQARKERKPLCMHRVIGVNRFQAKAENHANGLGTVRSLAERLLKMPCRSQYIKTQVDIDELPHNKRHPEGVNE